MSGDPVGSGVDREPPEGAESRELTPEELERGYELESGETVVVDVSDNRPLAIELGVGRGALDSDVIVVGRTEPRPEGEIGGPVHDAPEEVPFVYVGEWNGGSLDGRTVEIPATHEFPIGRSFQRGRFSNEVSRSHTSLRRQGDQVFITDLESKNGTTVRYKFAA